MVLGQVKYDNCEGSDFIFHFHTVSVRAVEGYVCVETSDV